MTMAAKGIAKLIEECGELQQILGKKLAYYTTDEHPDGKGSLNKRIEDELADVQAAIDLVVVNLNLDAKRVQQRRQKKYFQFLHWHFERDNNQHAIDAKDKP